MSDLRDKSGGTVSGASRRRGAPGYLLLVACIAVLALELPIDKHVETEIEHWFGFHAAFGLAASAALVVISKLLRRVIARPENYYDTH